MHTKKELQDIFSRFNRNVGNYKSNKRSSRVKFIFAWYDMWVGFFYDKKKHWLYFFPVPMFGIIIKFKL